MAKKKRPSRMRQFQQAMSLADSQFDLKTVIMIVGWVFTASALYYGLSGQITMQGKELTEQTATIQGLTQRLETAENASRAQERALIELTVTLRTKAILK